MAREGASSGVEAIGGEWTDLWQDIEGMRIEPDGAVLTFTARLARENGWSLAHADAVFAEYRRFLLLAATGKTPVTPSDAVDQAWHLHLSYTRHYWDVLCGRVVKRPLHHGPAAGGLEERERHRRQYEQTLRRYRAVFGTEPPFAIWPPAALLFGGRHVRLDASRYWLLPKSHARGSAAVGAALLLAACSVMGAASGEDIMSQDPGPLVLGLFAILFVTAVIIAAVRKARRRDPDGCSSVTIDGGSDCSDGGDGSGCSGGCGGGD